MLVWLKKCERSAYFGLALLLVMAIGFADNVGAQINVLSVAPTLCYNQSENLNNYDVIQFYAKTNDSSAFSYLFFMQGANVSNRVIVNINESWEFFTVGLSQFDLKNIDQTCWQFPSNSIGGVDGVAFKKTTQVSGMTGSVLKLQPFWIGLLTLLLVMGGWAFFKSKEKEGVVKQ